MSTLVSKHTINATFKEVRELSFKEKSKPTIDDNIVNNFLDQILKLKEILQKETSKINNIVDKLEKLTWVEQEILDEDCLMLINDIISLSKDLRSSFVKQYVSMNYIRSKGIAKNELKEFKNAIDDLREISEDLESIFFYLPNISEFKETTKNFSIL